MVFYQKSELKDPFTLKEDLFAPIPNFAITVLLIDDQPIIAEAVKRLLAGHSDIVLHYCSDPKMALEMACSVKPTVILLDLVMPEIDGLSLLKSFRQETAFVEIPIIVLSVEENPNIKAEAFGLGANDYIVKLPDRLELIARICYHSTAYIRLLERNAAYSKLEESQRLLLTELTEAASYVRSLLPLPMKAPVDIDWKFIPSTQLGGDAFGYHWIDERYFAIYLLDVCGHGVGAALHSISAMNVLRSGNLPHANFYCPSSVLKELNAVFQMEDHHDMFFTIWYGIYDQKTRELTYANGGHPPAILINEKRIKKLTTPGVAVGVVLDAEFVDAKCVIAKGDTLFIFSDGVFEIPKQDGTMMRLTDFLEFLLDLNLEKSNFLEDIVQKMRISQGFDAFIDDFSIMKLSFS